ncbi:hypothetical protein BGX27_002253 [Mortierella sp. AM989]|nr:hypothetical protein BGX27_002253 [Mortierella sp. AM989]
MLHAVFHDHNYTLVYAYKASATTGRFLCFDGLQWQELPRNVVAHEVETVCGTVLDALLKYIKPKHGSKNKEEIDMINQQKAQLKRDRTYISRHSSKSSILDEYRTQHGDNEIESKLDTNPDILVARNGVIDFQTGECCSGRPEDYMATKLDTDYNGLSSSTKDIDEFMLDIINNNTELISYVQIFWDMALLVTPASTVGWFSQDLEKLLEKWYVTAPYDIFFKSNRRTQAGGATPHLGTMRGARICVKEEVEPKDELNIEPIKIISDF